MKQDLSSSFYKRQGMSNNLSKIRQAASSTARILTYVYQTMKLMSNVSHSIPLLELSVSLNHRGCWRLLWHMAGPQTVCPGISQTILILFLPTRLGCELCLTPAVFFLLSALLYLWFWFPHQNISMGSILRNPLLCS